jgi:two-component system, OmpR family, sensor histidine kinase CpxA
MRLYLKLYLYFVVVISFLFILLPAIILFTIDKTVAMDLPQEELIDHIILTTDYIKNAPTGSTTFLEGLKSLAGEHHLEITLYDLDGKALLGTGAQESLDISTMAELLKDHKYTSDNIFKGTIRFIVPIEKSDTPFAYVSIINQVGRHGFLQRNLRKLLIACPIVFILIYPLALHFTKPLDRITEKAKRFSNGDFSDLEESGKVKGNDEIARLDRAFNHMAQNLVSMLESKKELISDMSHELGSPLSRMQVAVDIMQNQLEKDEMPSKKTLAILSKNIEEMSKIVRELLDLSRASKTYTLAMEKADLEEIVTTIVGDYQVITKKNNVTVVIHKEGDVSQVSIDRTKLIRVIQNLLSNALEYSPENSTIALYLKGEGEHFSFTIKDQGPGISVEDREKVFEPLYRPDPSRARKTGGTGLGLAIVSKFVSLHGGKVQVENPGGKGAIITFTI